MKKRKTHNLEMVNIGYVNHIHNQVESLIDKNADLERKLNNAMDITVSYTHLTLPTIHLV